MRAFALCLLLTTSCAMPVVGRTAENAEIVKIPLRMSNVWLVKTRTPVLIDAGTVGDMQALETALHEQGLTRRQIALVVLTHAHGDHAGLAAELREAGAQIMIGAGDRDRARTGKNDTLNPQGLEARLLRPFILDDFPELEADLVVEGEVDLSPWGIGGKAMQLPGHTAGSVAVVLDNHAAFVGDQVRGGNFDGVLFPTVAHEHYFHWDAVKNKSNLRKMLGLGIETFYPGHGGPLTRAEVQKVVGSALVTERGGPPLVDGVETIL